MSRILSWELLPVSLVHMLFPEFGLKYAQTISFNVSAECWLDEDSLPSFAGFNVTTSHHELILRKEGYCHNGIKKSKRQNWRNACDSSAHRTLNTPQCMCLVRKDHRQRKNIFVYIAAYKREEKHEICGIACL